MKLKTEAPRPESASELYILSDCHLLAKLMPTFSDRGCHVVSVADPYGRILGFLDRSRYFFFQVAPHLYSR
jgi:CBS-domain-containing membrane protein